MGAYTKIAKQTYTSDILGREVSVAEMAKSALAMLNDDMAADDKLDRHLTE